MISTAASAERASSRGHLANSGNGPQFQPIDIGHPDYVGLIAPDTAFWSLVRKEKLAEALSGGPLLEQYQQKADAFAQEMETLRFGLKPSAVYFNPTERCNLNCHYCYIPEEMRRTGEHMSEEQLLDALGRLRDYFRQTVPEGRRPQVIFHGAEPLLNRAAVFAGIRAFRDDFQFGVQTNATLLDDEAIAFLVENQIGIGLSLDGPAPQVSDRTRETWGGDGVFDAVVSAIERLRGYEGFNVICTVTAENMRELPRMVEFLHGHEVGVCMLNPVRCTLPGAREVRPADQDLAGHYLAALDRTFELYKETGRKLVVANFANVLLGIIAPTARRLMCDISPCGGGRCFFAVAPNGDLFPCSEFIGLARFKGGNLFDTPINDVLASEPFRMVTERKVEDIDPCRRCAVRHFCGSPCPAEAFEMNGGMHRPGAFCELYEEQARYALRLLADEMAEDYLWDGWDRGTVSAFQF